jgi:uncharacterized membrane protein YjfL (UPF0719 family)
VNELIAELHLGPMIGTVVYSIIGIVIFWLAFKACDKLTPFSMRKEIEEDHNTALAIIVGAGIIGLAIIISAAIRG